MAPRDEESAVEYNAGGYLQVHLQDTFKNGRYTVVRKLGWGHFSTVWLVRDEDKHRHSALKVVKSAGRYTETARDEIKLLQQISDTSPSHPGRAHIVSFLDSFAHSSPLHTHICIIFEPLGENLLSLIEKNRRKGVPRCLVKSITRQVLLGLQYLHEECDLVHTDIKPENIMMSIPNVESHIRTELSSSPRPIAHKLPIPPNPRTRTSKSSAVPSASRARHRSVHITESQPLASPSSHAFLSAHMNVLSSTTGTSSTTTSSSFADSLDDDIGGNSVDMMVMGESSKTTTPATSLGSGMSKLRISSSDQQQSPTPAAAPLASDKRSGGVHGVAPSRDRSPVAGLQVHVEARSASRTTSESERDPLSPTISPPHSVTVPAAPSGPSLLTQTAPPKNIADVIDGKTSPARSSTSTLTGDSSTSSGSSSGSDELRRGEMFHPICIKIADLGNATPSRKHYTEEIQTRQYRSPEAIVGRSDWGCEVDVWSVACVVFELLTAEYLFEPQSQGALFSKDDDHLAQIIELLGPIPPHVKNGGRYSRELFDHYTGELRYIKHLKPWPLRRVMVEKYLFEEKEAEGLCKFLERMLCLDPKKRASAGEMGGHEWLEVDWEREGEEVARVVW